MSKYIILLVKSFLVNFYRHLAIFFWSHWAQCKFPSTPLNNNIFWSQVDYSSWQPFTLLVNVIFCVSGFRLHDCNVGNDESINKGSYATTNNTNTNNSSSNNTNNNSSSSDNNYLCSIINLDSGDIVVNSNTTLIRLAFLTVVNIIKHFTIVIYDYRVVLTRKLPIL